VTVTYLVPLRREVAEPADGELVRYLRALSAHARVLVVDGSAGFVFTRHAAAFAEAVTHVPPATVDRCANGKAWGVRTGLRLATTEIVVIADDDVRWTPAGLERALRTLGGADLLVPQNFFAPLPWHAAWDTGRTLLNRAAGHDWPGTLVLRAAALSGRPAYDGDVLFENCELLRTVRAGGGRVVFAPEILVERRPPTAAHFLAQRPRQAYDDLAEPVRMAVMLAVAPAVLAGGRRALLAITAASLAAAEAGRRRDGGRAVFPWQTTLCSPLWLAERAVLSWWALWRAVSGRGVVYSGRRLRRAATRERVLRRRARADHDPSP
jgi:hypothetical protein